MSTLEEVAPEVAGGCVPPFRSALVELRSGTVVARTSESEGSIGRYTAYYSFKAEGTQSQTCKVEDITNPAEARRSFSLCNPNALVSSGIVWNPLDAVLDLVSLPESTQWGRGTRNGHYSFTVRGLAGVSYQISATMRFSPFSTRMGSVRTYWLGSWLGAISSEVDYAFTNVPLNLTLLTGTLDIENDGLTVPTVAGDPGTSPWAVAHWPAGLTRYRSAVA